MFHLQKLLKSLYTNNVVALKGLGLDGTKYASVFCNGSKFSRAQQIGGNTSKPRYYHTLEKLPDGVDKAGKQGLELDEATRLIEDMKASGRQVPYQINDADLEYFASLTSKKQRKRFIAFLYRKESMKLKDKQKRLEKREQRENETENVEYGPMPNKILLKLIPKTILEFDNWKFCQGMKFGQNLVFDFSYDQYMRRPDAISLCTQMSYVIHENKQAKESFHLHFVNHVEGSLTQKELVRTTKEDAYNKMMVTMSSESLLDRFPKEDIVYLSPDSPNIMRTFDHSKTYVIGALVDGHQIEKGVSLGVAKRLGVAHVRLPIDFYLQWGSGGGKNLTLDQVVKILATLKETNDWKQSMKHVPTRKHKGIKTPAKFLNQVYKARQGDEQNTDEFVFSRAKPRNKSVGHSSVTDNEELDFQDAFNDNKPRSWNKSSRNKSTQKMQSNFWEE